MQLVTEGEVLQLQNGPTAKSAGKDRDDGTHELEHAGDTTAAYLKTLAFSARSEFLAATGVLYEVVSVNNGHGDDAPFFRLRNTDSGYVYRPRQLSAPKGRAPKKRDAGRAYNSSLFGSPITHSLTGTASHRPYLIRRLAYEPSQTGGTEAGHAGTRGNASQLC